MEPTMPEQPNLFALPPAPAQTPEGFAYRPELLTVVEEAALAGWLATLTFEAFLFRGFEARRRVVSFGWQYDFTASRLLKADDMPPQLLAVRAKAAALAGLAPEALQQVLLNEYLPGAPIGWHRDRPMFDKVVGISLLSPCLFRFRRRTDRGFDRLSLTLEPRSAYVLDGPSRATWEHSIPPVEGHRYSITFRNFRE